MFLQRPAPWVPKKHLLGAGAVTLALAALFVTQEAMPSSRSVIVDGIPIPFLQNGDSLSASIDFYTTTENGIDVYAVRFEHGEIREWLYPDRIYLVHIPNSSIVREVSLDEAIRSVSGVLGDVDFFGYEYVTSDAVFELTARFEERLADRFPGHFFASARARQIAAVYGHPIEEFELTHDVTFQPTDGSFEPVNLLPDSLLALVVSEPGGARFAPVRSLSCGNGIVEGGEECDDGNEDAGDGCTSECLFTHPTPPPSSSSSSAGGAFSSSAPSSPPASSASSSSDSSDSSSSSSGGTGSSLSSSPSGTSRPPCGGIEGLSCASGERCEDDPADSCNPTMNTDCSGFCVPLTCGDGEFDIDEECDDGNSVHTDSCNNYCELLDVPF